MSAASSKSQVDRLGDRLKRAAPTAIDLQALDDYRRSFGEAYESVVKGLRTQLALSPTGRPEKSTTSIVEKLRRESIRLTQIQDIAGCRLVFTDLAEQDLIVSQIARLFPGSAVIDRRLEPSNGYRAVHVVTKTNEKLVEVQVRTSLQHRWAEVSEKFADRFGQELKYGGGSLRIHEVLGQVSDVIFRLERTECPYTPEWDHAPSPLRDLPLETRLVSLMSMRHEIAAVRAEISEVLDRMANLAQKEGQNQ